MNSNTQFSKGQLMTAYKWLAELHGVLCTNDSKKKSEITAHQVNLVKSLTKAITIKNKEKFVDDHLEFLLYKKTCKVRRCTIESCKL